MNGERLTPILITAAQLGRKPLADITYSEWLVGQVAAAGASPGRDAAGVLRFADALLLKMAEDFVAPTPEEPPC